MHPRRVTAVPSLLAVAALLAACGGAASTAAPTPAGPGASVAAPSVAATTAATPAATQGAPSPAASIDVGTSGQGLSNLHSYKMTISTTGSDSANIEQTIVNGTPPARSYSQTVGSVTLRIIEIGDDVYVDQGTGKFVKNAMPKATVDAMLQAFDPGSLLGAMKSQPELAFLENKGVEQKNGVSAVHMHADQNTPVPAGQSPVPAGAVIDIWIATEGNYLVALEASGMDTGSTVQSIQLEVTNINDPSLAITAPS